MLVTRQPEGPKQTCLALTDIKIQGPIIVKGNRLMKLYIVLKCEDWHTINKLWGMLSYVPEM